MTSPDTYLKPWMINVAQLVVPRDYSAGVEAVLENKDVGFVKPKQRAEVKIETFPFTRYGTVPATVTFVSQDAIQDEKRGLVFQTRLLLERPTLRVDERLVTLAPGMAIKTGERWGDRTSWSRF